MCVDAFSRYVEVAALTDKSSATVTSALDSVMHTCRHAQWKQGRLHHIRPRLRIPWFSHGASAASGDQTGVHNISVTSHRAAAHGTMERVNRTLADTMAHLEATEEKWHLKLPRAKLAYNAGIHRALTMGGIGLSPAMVHLGRQLQVPAAGGRLGASKHDIREGGGPLGYVEDTKVPQWLVALTLPQFVFQV